MPANWPTFINNVSSKLSSGTLEGPIEMGKFVASEYFNAVKSSQTLFGNIHKSGQLLILQGNDPGVERLTPITAYPPPIGNPDPNNRPDYPTEIITPGFGSGPVAGFTKAFSELHASLEGTDPVVHEPVSNPTVEEKFTIEEYSDFEEGYPVIEPFNHTCELEAWIEENKADLDDFKFYEYFKKNDLPDVLSSSVVVLDKDIKLADNIFVSSLLNSGNNNQSNVVSERLKLGSTGINEFQGKDLIIDDVNEHREEFITSGNATISFDIDMKNVAASGQPFEVFVGFTHYAVSYGAMLHQAFYQRSTVQADITLVHTYINQTSTNGGAWSVAYVDATTIRVSKSAGTTSSSGYGYLRVTQVKP